MNRALTFVERESLMGVMAEATVRVETEPHTETGKSLVGLAKKLDKWCEAETNVTHRQARAAVGLMVMGGAVAIAGWDNAWYHVLSGGDMKFFSPEIFTSEIGAITRVGHANRVNLVDLVRSVADNSVRKWGTDGVSVLDVPVSEGLRREALDALLKVEGRQTAKMFTAQLGFLAGMGVVYTEMILDFWRSGEKIKGSTGVGQWAAGVIKSIGEVL